MPPKQPLYPLSRVVDLAKARKVGFQRSAQLDIQNLGLTLDQAMEFVSWLTIDEYRTTLNYADPPPPLSFDDYLAPRRLPPDGRIQPIYIKLRIPSPSTIDYLMVASFHRPRPI